jgi:hypothetical protein
MLPRLCVKNVEKRGELCDLARGADTEQRRSAPREFSPETPWRAAPPGRTTRAQLVGLAPRVLLGLLEVERLLQVDLAEEPHL